MSLAIEKQKPTHRRNTRFGTALILNSIGSNWVRCGKGNF
jgi:hypothetical protein